MSASFFPKQQIKRFNYKPRYYDEDKAYRDERRGYKLEEGMDDEARIRARFRRTYNARRSQNGIVRKSVTRILLMVVLAALAVYFLYM